jgi:hypothetical protein
MPHDAFIKQISQAIHTSLSEVGRQHNSIWADKDFFGSAQTRLLCE